MLFEEYKYLSYQFPEPQYLGAKYTHLAWINRFIPKNINCALDAFAGSQSVAYLFKQLGLKTITNDFLNFNNQIGLSLIENSSIKLTDKDLELLFQENNHPHYNLFQEIYTNIFFEIDECKFLDSFRANIELLDNKYKKALAFTIINRSMTRKVTMGHFCHTQALNYANNPERIKRNRSLIRPIKDIFLDLLPKYNQAIFDNKQENLSFNQNTLNLIPTLKKIDLAYFDPPYCNSHADYQSFYHLLETYTEYWKGKEFINGTRRYEPQKYSGFDKKRDILNSLETLFDVSQNIPNWLISYNDRSYPSIDTLANIVSKYREVEIQTKTYQQGRGGKGSVAGSREILLVCTPKKQFFVTNNFKSNDTEFQLLEKTSR